MKRNKIRDLFLLSAVLLSLPCMADLQHTVTFDRNKLVLGEQAGGDGMVYTTIRYEDFRLNQQEGHPELPFCSVHLLVPVENAEFTVTIDSYESEEVTLPHPVYPAQTSILAGSLSVNYPFVTPDTRVYTSAQYPLSVSNIERDGYFDGDKHIVTVSVWPVGYIPQANKVKFYRSITFTIHYGASKRSVSKTNAMQPIHRDLESSESLEILQKTIANKDMVAPLLAKSRTRSVSKESRRRAGTIYTIPCYEYCIVTSRQLAPAFRRLVGWKRMKGLDAGVITMEEILNEPNIVGDTISDINDNAGKLRQYLMGAYANGTKYVLLGGNITVVPARFRTGDGKDYQYWLSSIPTDSYYGDLNSDWDKNRNWKYGEMTDVIDFWPELYVGRILCTTNAEVERYVNKLIRYEFNPQDADFSYVKNAFYTQSDEFQSIFRQAQVISTAWGDTIFSKQTIFEELPTAADPSPTFPSGKQVIDEINKGYGWISLHGHGNPSRVTVSSSGYDGKPGSYLAAYEDYDTTEIGNSWENLKNINSPSIVYSNSCTNMPIDEFNVVENRTSVGKSFTTGGNYGGPAFLGHTRLSYIETGGDLYKEFIKIIRGGDSRIGVAEAMSKGKYTKSDWYDRYECCSHNLLGCPEFNMWTDVPERIDSMYVESWPSSFKMRINGWNNCTFHLTGLFKNEGFFYHIKGSNSTYRFSGKSANCYTVMATRPNTFPYIPHLYIQNIDMTGENYIFGTSVSIGYFVDPLAGSKGTKGNVTVKSGADIIFEVSKDVLLDKGFEIEPGGAFEIKHRII